MRSPIPGSRRTSGRLARAAGTRRIRRPRTHRTLDVDRSRTHGLRLHLGRLHRSPRPARHRRQAALRRRAPGHNPDPRNQRTVGSRRLGQAMGSSARRAWCPGGGRRRDARQASSQQPRASSPCRRTGSAPRRTARCGQHRIRTVQPGRRCVHRGSLRAHPTAVDPPLRRSNPTRRRSQEGYSQLCLIVAGRARSTRRVIIISYAVGRTF